MHALHELGRSPPLFSAFRRGADSSAVCVLRFPVWQRLQRHMLPGRRCCAADRHPNPPGACRVPSLAVLRQIG